MIRTEHKIRRLMQVGELNKWLGNEMLDKINDDVLVSYGIANQGDDCVATFREWVEQSREWGCDFKDLQLNTISEIVDKIWVNKIRGHMVNVGYGRYKCLRGYAVESAAHPVYAGQAAICLDKAAVIDGFAARSLAQAELLEAQIEELSEDQIEELLEAQIEE